MSDPETSCRVSFVVALSVSRGDLRQRAGSLVESSSAARVPVRSPVRSPLGGVVAFKVVLTACVQVLMSALCLQPLSFVRTPHLHGAETSNSDNASNEIFKRNTRKNEKKKLFQRKNKWKNKKNEKHESEVNLKWATPNPPYPPRPKNRILT